MEGLKILTIVVELILAVLSGIAIATIWRQFNETYKVKRLEPMDYLMFSYILIVIFNAGINLYTNL